MIMETGIQTSNLGQAAALSAFNPIDRHFASFLGRLAGNEPEVQLAAALVSYYRSQGHICLDLEAFDGDGKGQSVPEELRGFSFPKASDWVNLLEASPVVGRPETFAPLILDDQARLYLHRYWRYETDLASAIKRLAQEHTLPVDWKLLGEGLSRLFPAATAAEVDWQMVAAFAAIRKRLCIISGGPGTGKTRTVVLLLALLLEQADNAKLRIALAAPTGKAAARLQEAVKNAKAALPCAQDIKDRLPEEASTIHRLLRSVPDSAYFRHDADNPLPVDVVVIDEASMVDLALMAKLVAAIPSSARLILLGDKDQLASVEAGAVLADICNAGGQRPFSSEFNGQFAESTGKKLPPGAVSTGASELGDCIVELRKNYRFGEQSGIYRLSQAVNDGDAERAIEALRNAGDSPDSQVSWRLSPEPSTLKAALKPHVLGNFSSYLKCANPATALRYFGQFRILCAVRSGPLGVEKINRLVEELLADAGLIEARGNYYAGRPLLITRNDYNLRLFNGDIGVLLQDPKRGELRAYFSGPEESLRDFLPLRLPEHETAYAMTVHKSQGSEFERVLMILPGEDSAILTRELVYTGLTRASKHVELWIAEKPFRTMLQRKISRRSGLRDALWKPINAEL
jgi:exodeoxyribonuclease V alpha subunit